MRREGTPRYGRPSGGPPDPPRRVRIAPRVPSLPRKGPVLSSPSGPVQVLAAMAAAILGASLASSRSMPLIGVL